MLSVGSAPESARMASVCCLVAVSVEKVIQYISASVPDPDPRVFGLPDPDPLVRGMDPDPDPALDPDPSIIKQIY